jgi:hypothetical protein
MKLAAEKNAELKKLSQYFEKIESIAAKMGVEVDDLIQEFKNNNTAAYATFKKSILAIAQKRQVIFKRADTGNSAEEASVIGMSILVNDDHSE